MNAFYKKYQDEIKAQYQLDTFPDSKVISPHLLELPLVFLKKIQSCIDLLFRLRSFNYPFDASQDVKINEVKMPHYSVLMAYDFHINLENNQISLIEVNTNASAYLLTESLYRCHNIKTQASDLLIDSFKSEMKLFGKEENSITLIDENVKEQKMYPEFLLFQSLFRKHGYNFLIEDVNDIQLTTEGLVNKENKNIGFVYNRYCDFLFNKKSSEKFLKAYLDKLNLFSPHPKEYLLLASKKRFIDWEALKKISSDLSKTDQSLLEEIIPESLSFAQKDLQWEERKKYVFKPFESYGSKQVYVGKSITKKMFDYTKKNHFLIQEYRPPGKVRIENEDMKFDLRFYVYQNKIQQSVGRIYKGQVTNFSDPQSGFCAINWT